MSEQESYVTPVDQHYVGVRPGGVRVTDDFIPGKTVSRLAR